MSNKVKRIILGRSKRTPFWPTSFVYSHLTTNKAYSCATFDMDFDHIKRNIYYIWPAIGVNVLLPLPAHVGETIVSHSRVRAVVTAVVTTVRDRLS